MNPDNMNSPPLAFKHDFDKAMLCERVLIHRNLIALGEIRIKIVFSGKKTERTNPAGSSQPQFDGKFHGLPVHHRERPRLTGTDGAGLRVRFFPKCGGAPTEYFRPGQELGMDFQANNGFIFHKIPLSCSDYCS
jgi:hypothetical protein